MQTAQAQGQMNRSTAQYQQQLNMVNQVTPYGNLTYSQTGNNFVEDPNGQTYWRGPDGSITGSAPMVGGGGSRTPIYMTDKDGRKHITGYKDSGGKSTTAPGYTQVKGSYIPSYTATQTLTPEQEAIKKQTDAASLNIATLANQQSGFLGEYMKTPFKYEKSDLEDYVYKLGTSRLDPRFAQEQDSARTQLINSGIRPGTPAFDQAMSRLGQDKNDAYNQLALGANDQAFNQALTVRNQPINEISALMSNSQIQQPNFVNTPQSQVANVDYAGLVGQKYQADSQAAQAKMGGMFGLLAAPFGAMSFSDRRLKKDVVRIGRVGALDRFMFKYIWDADTAPMRFGFMADQVRKVAPWAVHREGDYDMVDYGALA